MVDKFQDTPSVKETEELFKGLYLFKGLLSKEEQQEYQELEPQFQEIVNTIDIYIMIRFQNSFGLHTNQYL